MSGDLRTWRTARGLSLTDVSGLTGLSPSQLSRIERGKNVPPRATQERIAQSLGASPEELFPALTPEREPVHGTHYAYSRRGCRCDLCRAWGTENSRRTRARNRGKPTPDSAHGENGYDNWGCRCDVCSSAVRLRNEQAAPRREAARLKLQAATAERATRHYFQWTGPELEIIARDDLTPAQAALMIGRTLAAVMSARSKLRREPRLQRLAGVELPKRRRVLRGEHGPEVLIPPANGFLIPYPQEDDL